MNLLQTNTVVPGNFIIIKRHKFEQKAQKTESGFEIPQMDAGHSDAGVSKAKLKDITYNSTGEVVKVGTGDKIEEYGIKVGDTVSVHPFTFERSNFGFFNDRTTPVSTHEGYARIPVEHIEVIIPKKED